MNRYIRILVFILPAFLFSGCYEWGEFNNELQNPEHIDELVAEDDFDWLTATTITFSLKNAPLGVMRITSTDGTTTFHKGNNTGLQEYYSIKITLPDYIGKVNINDHIVPVDGDFISYDFHSLKNISIVDYSLLFDGTDDYVEMDDEEIIDDYPFTLAAWIKTDGFSYPDEDMVIVNIADPTKDNKYYGIFIGSDEGGAACIRAHHGSSKTDAGTTDLSDGEWHFVVGVYEDKNDRRLYVDGQLEATGNQNSNFASSAEKTVVGRWGDETPKSYFNGNIDEVSVWSTDLTASQINNIMNNGINGSEDDLEGYWKFDDGSGSAVTDETENEYDGTIYGAGWVSDEGGGGNPDNDGDGVDNENDDYPSDATRAFNNYYPAGGFGSLAFEDLWPGTGDYDFNDLVIDYQFKTVTNASNYVVEILAQFVVRAIGATFENGFGFQFPNSNVASGDLVVTGYQYSGNIIQLNANGTEAQQNLNTVIVFDNAFNILPHSVGESGVNTDPDGVYSEPDTVLIYMSFAANTYSENDINISNFNPFIFINQNRLAEVHLPDHAPTSKADMSLLGTFHDNSDPATGRYYKTDDNLPWAINIYESFDYPIEKVEITQAHLKFGQWAISSGSDYSDWYQDNAGYRQDGYIYD